MFEERGLTGIIWRAKNRAPETTTKSNADDENDEQTTGYDEEKWIIRVGVVERPMRNNQFQQRDPGPLCLRQLLLFGGAPTFCSYASVELLF